MQGKRKLRSLFIRWDKLFAVCDLSMIEDEMGKQNRRQNKCGIPKVRNKIERYIKLMNTLHH